MNPRELLRLLLERDGLNPYSLSNKLDNRTKQPQLQRFLTGVSSEPRRSTLAPVAEFFGVPLEAFFDEQAAHNAAVQLGLTAGHLAPLTSTATATITTSLHQALPVVLEALTELTHGQWRMIRARLDDLPEQPKEAAQDVLADVGPMLGVHPKEKPKRFPAPPLPADARGPAAPPGRRAAQRGAAPTEDAEDAPQ